MMLLKLNSDMPSITKDTNYKITVFDSFDDVESLWRSIEENGDCFAFQTYDWLTNWYAYIGKNSHLEPCIVSVESSQGQPLMLLPFAIQRQSFISTLVWLGGKITDYHGPILNKCYSSNLSAIPFKKIWSDIRTQLPPHNAIDLQKQPEFIIEQRNPFLFLDCTPHTSSAHFTRLVGPIESFIKSKRSSEWSRKLRSKQKRLKALGELKSILVTKKQDIDKILPEMFSQKAISYKAMGVENIFDSQEYIDFFYHMTRNYSDNSFVHLFALLLNNQTLATHWGLLYKKRFYHLFPTYVHNELARYSPGIILFRNIFEWGIENGVEICDFSVGDDPHKNLWCDQELRLFDYLKATSPRGLVYVIPRKLQRLLKRKIKQTPIIFSITKDLRKRIARLRFGQ